MTTRLFCDRWLHYERRLVESIRDLTHEQLALRATRRSREPHSEAHALT